MDARVEGTWTGAYTGVRSEPSSKTGSALFSLNGLATSGCATLTITNVTLAGYAYQKPTVPTSSKICW